MNWLAGNWSNPVRIHTAIEQKWWQPLKLDFSGVYRLIALEKDELTARINRVCGVDSEGTLYIGCANNLHNRLSDLIATHRIDYKIEPHTSSILTSKLKAIFSPEQLAFSWERNTSPLLREGELIAAYVEEFGERPPLNRQGGASGSAD